MTKATLRPPDGTTYVQARLLHTKSLEKLQNLNLIDCLGLSVSSRFTKQSCSEKVPSVGRFFSFPDAGEGAFTG